MTDPASEPEDDRPIVPAGWRPTVAEPVPVVRCTVIKKDGKRCGRWSLRGATVCYAHGGRLNNVKEHADAVVEGARMRIIGLADLAIDQLEDLVQNGTAEKIRLDAARDLLDRANVKGAIDINVEVQQTESAADRMKARLQEAAKRLETKTVDESDLHLEDDTIVDAEIVSDPNEDE